MIRRFLLLLTITLALPFATPFAAPAAAQDVDPIAAATSALDTATSEYQAIDTAFNGRDGAAQAQALKARATAVKQTAADQVTALQAQMQLVDARVAQLGPVTPGVVEAPDIQAQRKLLAQQHSTIDSAIKRGKLLGTEADQLATEIDQSQADVISEKMSQRVASPLGGSFWRPLMRAFPHDLRRFWAFMGAQGNAMAQGSRNGGLPSAIIGLVIALGLIGPARLGLRHMGRRYVIERVPGSRIRRSSLALWLAVVGTLVPALAMAALVMGLHGGDMIAPSWEVLARRLQIVSLVAALIVALGGALLQRSQPSWRLLPLSDGTAQRLRPLTFAAAAVTLVVTTMAGIASGMGASGYLVAAVDLVSALIYITLAMAILISGARARALVSREADEERGDQSVLAFLSLAAWGVLILAVVSLLAGYIPFALFIVRFMVWMAVVAGTLYLSLVAVDDICSSLFDREGRLADSFAHGFGVRRSLIDQFGVGLSALLRILLILLAVGMVSTPFGSNVSSIFDQLSQIAQGVTIGQITISPGAILRALAVLAVGLFVVRAIQRWLTGRYLPATDLDAGAQNSIAMVTRYMGLILAVLWAMASLGIGIERIALLLSALSVGIGFGLQAITQNFVSGLILLAERPVKIGDWVKIGDQEGDVKRISVRATEIQIADRSTLIVPNSELITKSIVNKTLADPVGRIQLKFSVPLGTDVEQVRTMVTRIYQDHAEVLDDPRPSIFIDSIADGRVNFNGYAFVASPRAVYATRSDLWFTLLSHLPQEGIELGTTPQQVQWIGQPDRPEVTTEPDPSAPPPVKG
ncbi:MAG: mechanosensitive ion channel family protein [Sphingomonadales bacterium]|nr:mechanosensitive ion channel family protein [Sphingomonadales bacterium]MDE2170883.1 mechanosensitive ion channel family protein [Sphingomonadales bacterium]